MIRLLRTLSLVAVTAAVLLVFSGCPSVRIPDPAVRFVAFGDSSTDGPSERQYWDIVRERLGEAPPTFSNEGVGGERSSDGLRRLDFLIERGIFPNAHTIFYWEGAAALVDFVGNRDKLLILDPASPDYPYTAELHARLDEIQTEIEAAIAAGQKQGWRVFVATYFPFRDGFGKCGFLPFDLLLPQQAVFANNYQALLNDRIRAATANRGAALVDVAAIGDQLLADPANYFDCNHLSARGNERVADVFMQALAPPPP